MYVLEVFEVDLKLLGLYEAVRATCFGIKHQHSYLLCYFGDVYCLTSGKFFTSIGELGMVLHKMWEVSNLPMGSKLYKEYFPYPEELVKIKKDELALYEMYQDHYYIYLHLHPSRGSMISLKPWVEYLFPIVDRPVENIKAPVSERKIAKTMKAGNH